MKAIQLKVVCFSCLFVYQVIAFGQVPQNCEYLDRDMIEVEDQKKAVYVREVVKKEDGTYLVNIRFRSGSLKLTGHFLDEALQIETGHFQYFFANGLKESEGDYNKGIKTGTWKRWDYEGNPRPDRFYPDEVATIMVQESSPAEFPGGDESLTMFLDEHMVYPEEAKKTNSEGTVYVAFRINEHGYISQVEVIQGANFFLDNEAKRLIYEMPQWKPAKKNGEYRESKFILPVVFDLDHYSAVRLQIDSDK